MKNVHFGTVTSTSQALQWRWSGRGSLLPLRSCLIFLAVSSDYLLEASLRWYKLRTLHDMERMVSAIPFTGSPRGSLNETQIDR